MPSYIETFSGKRFFPLSPDGADVCIEDIAHALARQCRFAGHVSSFMSVGEHSLNVSYVVEGRGGSTMEQLWGLLHDASEAYLVDLPTPLKSGEFGAAYRKAEDTLMRVITERFGLPPDMPEIVREADATMLATEARELMHFDERNWQGLAAPIVGGLLRLGDFYQVEHSFIQRFNKLMAKR